MATPYIRELCLSAEILQLQGIKEITREDVRRSFLQSVKVMHPDKRGGSFNAFDDLMRAYHTLLRYFDTKDAERKQGKQPSGVFKQNVFKSQTVYCESDSAYFLECRCGELCEFPSIALALGVRNFTCLTCSLVYHLVDE
ncbi:hypothetical protein BgAZ_500430 [Babesia gibsoni]|uniref:J domain-containing protein n=1 Tax=Babesia gibsoni TaxID=33632 RepID=A0AAD8LM85_BABGI|nr:hypothetical protein BgAZ_500430 [Babesia gibsoni]